MREELRLQFKTYFTIDEEGTEKHCYECWIAVQVAKGDNTSDSDFINEARRVQTPIFESEGYTIHEIEVYRPSEFEYKKYLKSNEKAKYNRALQRGN